MGRGRSSGFFLRGGEVGAVNEEGTLQGARSGFREWRFLRLKISL